MIRLCHQTRSAITCLLTVWMTVTGCGVWVTHAHAAGGIPHVHGWGWHPAGCPVCRAAHSDGPVTCHRHLLVLGLESPSETPTGDSAPADGSGGVAVIDQCDAPSPVDLSLALAPPVVIVEDLPSPLEHRFFEANDRHPLGLLPPFALHAVSGVLRS